MNDNTTRITNDMLTQQVGMVVIKTRENFTDLLDDYFKGKNITLRETDKRDIEQLFSDSVQTYMVAEMAAITSFPIYMSAINDEILTNIVPALLDKVEITIKPLPDILVNKTSDCRPSPTRRWRSPRIKQDLSPLCSLMSARSPTRSICEPRLRLPY